MNISFLATGILIFLAVALMIFCAFFASRLALMKNRSKLWGIVGFFFNVIGLVIVSFLPSKRNDSLQTNPVIYFIKRIPTISKRTILIIAVSAAAVILTVTAYDNIPKFIYKITHSAVEIEKPETITFDTVTGKVTDIFSSDKSTFILTDSKDLYCCGKTLLPQLENEEKGVIYKNTKKAAANENQLFILDTNGDLYATGYNENGLIPADDKEITDMKLISKDVSDFSVSEKTFGYIKENKKLYIYGDNTFGQSTDDHDKAVISNVKKVCCEANFTVILQHDGEVKVLGSNTYGQFGLEDEACYKPTSIAKDVADIAAGDSFILLLTKDGKVLSCGSGSFGQLGNQSFDNASEFTEIADNVSKVFASKNTAFALRANGELLGWGQGVSGQLGTANRENVNTPTTVIENISLISTSGTHTVVLQSDNKLLATGADDCGQNAKAKSTNKFSAFAAIK